MHRALRRASRQLTELAASESRFRDLTELSADWFWETDAEHRITWISAGGSVATLFGNLPTFGKRFWEIPRVEVEPRALEAHLERLGEEVAVRELEIQRTDERGARLIHIISGQARVTPRGEFLGYRGVGRDVTEQRRAERAVFEAKERVELALDGGNLAEWHFDVERDELYAGDGWVRFLGHGRSPAVGKGAMLYDMMHPEDRERSRGIMVRALKGELEEYVDEFRVQTRAGDWKWLQARGRVVERDAEGRALRVSGTIADIDSRKRAETALQEAEARYRSLVDLAPNGVLVHSAGVIEYANPAAARLLKAESPAQLIGTRLEALFNPADLPRVRERQSVLLAAPAAVGFEERRMLCLDGTELIVEGAAVSFLERGRMVVQGVLRDVTEERQARQALAEREQRFRDVVHASGEYVWETDAQWRYTYLSERVEAVLGYARNELLGRAPHEFMPLGEAHFPDTQAPFRDVVRRSITKSGGVIWQSVSGVPRLDAAGARTGYRGTAGDVPARKQAEARIEYLATRDALTGLPNRALLTDRAGQAILTAARSRAQFAVLCVDLDRFKLVNDSLGHQAGDALLRAVADRLQNTLGREDTLARLGGDDFVLLWSGLVLHWHPVVRGRGQVVGAEALVRWNHSGRGLMMPEEFVPLAEECGLIRAIGEWTLERALSQAGAWQRKMPGCAWFAVNVSAPELAQGDAYVERIEACLRANSLEGSCLELEVTERVLMSSLAENVETLRRIGALGVRFAIDDFGTGYSSLAYPRRLPAHKLNIDRSFLRAIDSHAADEAIVRAIAAMAGTLGIAVAAEGVESEAQLKRLLALGCEEWQGHYFSAPLDASAFEALLLDAAAGAARIAPGG